MASAHELFTRFGTGHERHGQRWSLQRAATTRDSVTPSFLLELGLPTLGLAFAISVVTTYGPVVLIRTIGSPAGVGTLIGGEGLLALAIPLVSGALSDRLPGRAAARRFPFIVAGALLAGAGLALLPFASSYTAAAVSLLAFFVGYYLYYPPYRALYADLLPRNTYARPSQARRCCAGPVSERPCSRVAFWFRRGCHSPLCWQRWLSLLRQRRSPRLCAPIIHA